MGYKILDHNLLPGFTPKKIYSVFWSKHLPLSVYVIDSFFASYIRIKDYLLWKKN